MGFESAQVFNTRCQPTSQRKERQSTVSQCTRLNNDVFETFLGHNGSALLSYSKMWLRERVFNTKNIPHALRHLIWRLTYVVRCGGGICRSHDGHAIVASRIVYAVQLNHVYAVGQTIAVGNVGGMREPIGGRPGCVHSVLRALAARCHRLLVFGGRGPCGSRGGRGSVRRRRRCSLFGRNAVNHRYRFPDF